MKRWIMMLAAAIAFGVAATAAPLAAGSSDTKDDADNNNYPSAQSVGLVLSGGGAKGIAHIGVIQALEENNIPIDYVAGTSMGAIVGGLYAAGYTPAEMMELILSPSFTNWSTGRIDPNLTYYFLRKPQTPAFANVSINVNPADSLGSGGIMPSSLINPLPMNFAFMDLFAPYTAQCDGNFDNLFVPFRCVTSDVVHKHKIVCSKGMLSDAIRASMSFPAVFEPIKMDGVEVYDGGIYDNFPVDVMRQDFAPDIMIGVDVHAENVEPSNSIVNQLENMIIQNNDYTLPADEGIRIHVDVSKFSLLDFGKAKEIYAIGYARALEMMDSIRSRVTSRIPASTRNLQRAVFKSQTPYLRFDSVHVTGGTPSQNSYIKGLFEPRHHADTFGVADARLAYYRAITPGKLRNLFPQAHYNKATGLFTLDLDADVKNNFSLGAGGYLSSSANSMIFVSAEYSSLSFSSWATRLMGWIGQSYMAAQFNTEFYLSKSTPSALELEAVISRQKFYENGRLFFEDNTPAFVSEYDGYGRLSYAWAMGRRAKASIGVGGGSVVNKFFASDHTLNYNSPGREQTRMDMGQALLRIEYNSLDNNSYPVAGGFMSITAMQTLGKYHHKVYDTGATFAKDQNWFQAELKGSKYWAIGHHFALGASVDALVSNRHLLDTYYASVVNAPSFTPLPSLEDVFNKAFHANSFVAAGITPVWRPFTRAQLRLNAYAFVPLRRIMPDVDGLGTHYSPWFNRAEFIGEADLVYNLPFASFCAYANYLSYPAKNWNLGLSFGLYFTAPKFLR